MKGVFQQNLVLQRALRFDHLTEQINSFEKCDYYEIGKESNIQKFRIQMQESISLKQLIELCSCHYLVFYKGQLLMIITEILNHLSKLHQLNLSHGQLQPKNILIRLGNQTGFSITHLKIEIKQIHFICYKYFEDSNYQMNVKDDIKQICLTIIEFIEMMQKQHQSCDILYFFKSLFQLDYQNNQNYIDANHFLNLLQNIKEQYLNEKEQKLKENEIDQNKSSIFERLFKPTRESFECYVIDYLEELNNQNLNTEIQIQKIRNDKQKLREEEILEVNSKQFKIPESFDQTSIDIVQNLLKMSVLKKFCVDVGRFFQKNEKTLEVIFLEFENKANNQLQVCYEIMLPQIIHGYFYFDSIYEELQSNVDKYYKFKIKKPIEKAKQIYSNEWLLALQNQDIFNFDVEEFNNTVKDNVKSQLKEYYELMVYLENIQLDNELI